jgi:hypothetical protein
MHYQSPLQTPEDDLVDERWDTNLGFYSSDSSLKEQPVALYKNTNIRYNDNNNQVNSNK